MALRAGGLAAIVAGVFVALGFVGDLPPAPGDLDTTFGNGGRVGVEVADWDALARSVIVQDDGKIVLVGSAYHAPPPPPPPPPPEPPPPPAPPAPKRPAFDQSDFLAVRLTANGSLDPSFGNGGIVRTPINLVADGFDQARGAALTPDGKIVVAGVTTSSTGSARARCRPLHAVG